MGKKIGKAFVQVRHREHTTFDSRVYKGEDGRIGVYVDTYKRASFIVRYAAKMSMVRNAISVPKFTESFNKAYSTNLKDSHVEHVFKKLQECGIMTLSAEGWRLSPRALDIFKSLTVVKVN